MDACPPLEDIAAFLDGTLSPEERTRITEHLARCESCYEIFAGAVHFQEEEEASSADDIGRRDVIQFPFAQGKIQENQVRVEPPRPPRRASRWLGLAASAVLSVGLGYMVWQYSRVLPEVTVAGVAEPLQGKDGISDALYEPERDRGEHDTVALSQAPLFLAGVYLVDLRLSIPAGEARQTETEGVLQDLANALEQTMGVSPETVAFFRNQSQQADFEVLSRELPKQESALENELAEDPLFRFGIWAEGGHVSAALKSSDFFEQRANRRFLALIPREIRSEDPDRYGPILDNLQKIEPLWERSPRDYDALAGHFESIIRQFERIQNEDQEDFDPLPAP
jgi:hypothetical protein